MNHWISYANTFPKGDPRSIAFGRTSNKFVKDVVSKFDHTSRVNGLLFGEVQSGKTTHTFSVIAATADGDPGFRTFVYLTSNSNQLQQQTYGDALMRLNQTFEICDTTDEVRFKRNLHKPNLIILNKDPNVLRKWLSILASDERTAMGPIFIVDDEGDAASQNTKVNNQEVSTIHGQISELRLMGTGSIYLQVTATPQAIFLQSNSSEQKPKFIHYFEPGAEYLGGEFFFGSDDTTTHKVISESDIDVLLNSRAPSEGIKRALASFVCVTAYFIFLNKNNANCLIHPHYSIDSHRQVHEVVEKYLSALLRENPDSADVQLLNEALLDLNQKLTPEFTKEKFWQIHKNKIPITVRTINAINKVSEDEYRNGFNVIVGANAIGRGVAFPHLQTVYYTRRAKIPQADTFWQHSRIFGYDRDWKTLRIFMPANLFRLFRVLQDQNSRLIEMIRKGERDVLQIPLPRGVNPTRKNIIDKSSYRFIVGGTNYFPPLPDQANGAELDKLFAQFDDKYTGPVDLDIVKQAIKRASSPDADWKTASFLKAIDHELSDPKCMLLIRRGRKISANTGAMLSPNDREFGENLKDHLVLTAYRVDGLAGSWSEKKDFWMLNLKLPGSLFYHEVD